MEDCVFCKIIKKELPCSMLYEDEVCIAILDINPVAEGHTLIIPKKHFESMTDAPEDTLKHLITVARLMGEKSKSALNATGYNLFNANGKDAQQSEFHLHLHIIPRHNSDKMNLWFLGKKKVAVPLAETLLKFKN